MTWFCVVLQFSKSNVLVEVQCYSMYMLCKTTGWYVCEEILCNGLVLQCNEVICHIAKQGNRTSLDSTNN